MNEKWFRDSRVELIVRYVRWAREAFGINTSRGRKMELSCEMFGEFRNLLNIQLLTTPEFEDAWRELQLGGAVDTRIVNGLLRQIRQEINSAKDRLTRDAELNLIADAVAKAMSDEAT
jgi:hypothetical protein